MKHVDTQNFYDLTDEERDKLIKEIEKSPNKSSAKKLSVKEAHATKLLDYCLSEEQKGGLTDQELSFLQKFIIENIGNKELNKKLTRDNSMSRITYIPKVTTNLYEVVEKLDAIYTHLNDNITLDKLNLVEY